jgi:2-oxoisovalerate dehydrogenase E1 component
MDPKTAECAGTNPYPLSFCESAIVSEDNHGGVSENKNNQARLLDIYRLMLTARMVDRVESELTKAGEAFFHVSGAGHEGSAILNGFLTPRDWLHLHYRDKALMLARGISPEMFFHSLLCSAQSHSVGRQMSAHMSAPHLRILSMVGPVGNHALQSVGVASVIKDDPDCPIVVCSMGDGTAQQGEVLEAIAEASRSEFPVLFWIEDNDYSISTTTENKTFYSLPKGRKQPADLFGIPIQRVDGRDIVRCQDEVAAVIQGMRSTRCAAIVVFRVARLSSHTNADDERVYRPREEIEHAKQTCDPIQIFAAHLIALGLQQRDLDRMAADVEAEVRAAALAAKRAPKPASINESKKPLPISSSHEAVDYRGNNDVHRLTMLEAIRGVLQWRMKSDPRVMLYGEDIEDPKGDVFGVTRGLTTAFPGRVRNAPLSESTIVGVSIGKALAGHRPVAFIQFADFLPLAFNQIISELGSMHWRTNGEWQCPVIILAACGGYRPGLGPFHAQTLESVMAHVPGVDVLMPSDAADAAGLLNAAFRSERPTIFLYPKSCLNDPDRSTSPDVEAQLIPLGKARLIKRGDDLTIVTWGSTVPICERVARTLEEAGSAVDLIDLRSISPWDKEVVLESAARTRRLVVVHEDNRTCGFGAEVIATVVESAGTHVSCRRVVRPDTFIPCNYSNQLEVLPSFRRVLTAAAEMLDLDLSWDEIATVSSD